jgi:hypothetical protein
MRKANPWRLIAAMIVALVVSANAQDAWTVHDRNRPNPAVVTPANTAGGAPSDAIVIFDGHGLDAFKNVDGGITHWRSTGAYFEVVPGTSSIETKQAFGDCQLHVEWASPNPPQGEDQMRGNSGVIMMGMFEIQVLDSYNARTYADGQAAAIYGQYPPLVNASRAPGEWQTYDIVFRGPRFDSKGRLLRRANVTLVQNGILVQDAAELSGPTAYHNRPPYFPIPEKLPFVLQEHGTPVRYRNIWVRPLSEEADPVPVRSFIPLRPDPAKFASYAGTYESGVSTMTVTVSGGTVQAKIAAKNPQVHPLIPLDLMPISEDAFMGHNLPGGDETEVLFTRDAKDNVVSAVAFLAGHYLSFERK